MNEGFTLDRQFDQKYASVQSEIPAQREADLDRIQDVVCLKNPHPNSQLEEKKESLAQTPVEFTARCSKKKKSSQLVYAFVLAF
jgi:hypothetical protein